MWERRGLKTATSFFLRAGQTWRVSQGLPRVGNEAGILHDKNDWSYGGNINKTNKTNKLFLFPFSFRWKTSTSYTKTKILGT